MALNLQMSYTDDSKERALAAGVSAASLQEGQALAAVIEDGIEKVKVAGANDAVIGFVYGNSFIPTQKVEFAELTLDAEGKGSIVSTTPIVANSASKGTISGNEIAVTDAENAGKTITVSYKRELTSAEASMLYGDKKVNAAANGLFEQVTVLKGNGEIFTDCFDSSKDWSAAKFAAAGADGLIPSSSATNLRVIAIPSAAVPFLGLAVSL